MDLHIHDDAYMLQFCVNGDGNHLFYWRDAVCYAMQGEGIVGIFYTREQAVDFYNKHKPDKVYSVICTFSKKLWEARHKNWYYFATGEYTLHE